MIDVSRFLSNSATRAGRHDSIDYALLVEGVKACSMANNLSSIIVDFDRHETLFMSDNLIYLDEATFSDFKRNSENPYWALVSDDTLETLSRVQEDYYKLKNLMSKEEYSNHLCVMDYPIAIRGRELYIGSRFTPLVLGPDGSISLGLFTFSPSSKKEVSCLVVTSSGKRWAYGLKNRHFYEFNLGINLTLAEKTILQRARKGMSNEEIANELCLSLNTIKSHKLHIFKKLGVKTITEALVVVGNYKLL